MFATALVVFSRTTHSCTARAGRDKSFQAIRAIQGRVTAGMLQPGIWTSIQIDPVLPATSRALSEGNDTAHHDRAADPVNSCRRPENGQSRSADKARFTVESSPRDRFVMRDSFHRRRLTPAAGNTCAQPVSRMPTRYASDGGSRQARRARGPSTTPGKLRYSPARRSLSSRFDYGATPSHLFEGHRHISSHAYSAMNAWFHQELTGEVAHRSCSTAGCERGESIMA